MVSRPERAFRIADGRYPLVDGTGAFLQGARWNSPGHRVIYASESYAGALLETLVHTRIGKLPRHHMWIEIEIPPSVSVETIRSADLPEWDAFDSPAARGFGDSWIAQQRTAVLVVPSLAASGLEHNILINQDHPEFSQLRASKPQPTVLDARLFLR
jgi:RES domain-containing protein